MELQEAVEQAIRAVSPQVGGGNSQIPKRAVGQNNASRAAWRESGGSLSRQQAEASVSEIRSALSGSDISNVYYRLNGELGAFNGTENRWDTMNIVLNTGKAYGDSYTERRVLFADGSNSIDRRDSNDRIVSSRRVSDNDDSMIKKLREWARRHNYGGNILITKYYD